jgi:tetratricopeptide (TPR) repeat protein
VGLVGLHQYLDRVEELLEAQRFEEALSHCHNILRQNPRHVDTYRLMGRVLLEQHVVDEALDVFQRVLSVDPEDLVSHAGTAIAYKDKGELPSAVWHMERAAEIDAYNSAIQGELRDLYDDINERPDEGKELSQAALARLNFHGGLYQQAKDKLQSLLTQYPERHDLQVLLAEVLYSDNRLKEAANTSAKILNSLPDCIKANAILGLYHVKTGKNDVATKYAQKLVPLMLPEQISLDDNSLAGQFFSTIDSQLIPEKVVVEELDYRKDGDPSVKLEASANPGTKYRQTITNIPTWINDPSAEDRTIQQDFIEQDSETEDIDDVFDWLRTIAEEEGPILEAGGQTSEEAPHSSFGLPEDADATEDQLYKSVASDARVTLSQQLDYLSQERETANHRTPGDITGQNEAILQGEEEEFPEWLEEVIGFTDSLESDDPNAIIDHPTKNDIILGSAISGGIKAYYRGGPTGSYSTSQLEDAIMSETNKQDNDKSNDLTGDGQEEEWLEELGDESEDSALGFTEAPGVDEDDLGEIEPGQEIPDWLRADIIAAESDVALEPEKSDEVPIDETVIAASLEDLADSEVPEWLEEELANDVGDGSKSEDLSWLEDIAEVPEEALVTDTIAATAEQTQSEEFSSLVSDIPDDPDDAVAWLEELATEQEDIPLALDSEQPDMVEISLDEEIPQAEQEVLDVELPADEEVALNWLNEVVSASMATAAANRVAGASSIVVEPETPKSAFSVEEAMGEAERMMLEDQIVFESESSDTQDDIAIDELPDDEQVVVDWLDELATVEVSAQEEIDVFPTELPDESEISEEAVLVPEDATDELDWLDILGDQSLEIDEPVASIDEEMVATVVVAGDSEDLSDLQIEIDELEDSESDLSERSDLDQYEEAHLALESGDYDQAIAIYSDILDSGEDLPDLIANLESLVEAYYSQTALIRLLGEAYTKNGQLQEALEMYKKALDNI